MSNTPWRRVTVELEVDSGVTHSESASVPNTPGAAKGTYWVRSDSPTVPMFTDSDGVDFVLSGGGDSTRLPQMGVITDTLRFFIDFNNATSWVPNQTTTWTDTISGVEGTATNTSIVDGHLNFNGTTSIVSFGTLPSALENIWAGGGAVSGWVRPVSDGEGSLGRILDTTNGGNEGTQIYVSGESGGAVSLHIWVRYTSGWGQWQTTNLDLTLAAWNGFSIIFDSDSPATPPVIYVGGESVAVTTTTVPTGTIISDAGNPLIIGNQPTPDRTFDGDIDMLWMHDSAISAEEVADSYNATSTRFGFGASAAWAASLAVGNISDGTDVVLSTGDTFRGPDGAVNFSSTALLLRGANSTTSTGQTVRITSGISSASGAHAGDIEILGGVPTGTGAGRGGDILIASGDGSSGGSNAPAGDVTITTGEGQIASAAGGDFTVTCGSAAPGTGTTETGNITLTGGHNPGTNQNNSGGEVTITGGTSLGTTGGVSIRSGDNLETAVPGTNNFIGNIVIATGTPTAGATRYIGGSISVTANGDPSAGSNNVIGGDVTIAAGDTGAANANGGDVNITAGNTNGFNVIQAGNISLTAGDLLSTNPGAGSEGGSIILSPGVRSVSDQHDGMVRIDSTGTLQMLERPAVVTGITGGEGRWWVRNDSPNVPMFTDDAGGNWQLAGVGSGNGLQAAYETDNTIVTDGTNGAFSVTGTETITLMSTGANASLSALNVSITSLGGATAGDVILTGGTATGATNPGGDIFLNAGDGNTTGTGGSITANAGDGGTTGVGGPVSFTGGAGGSTSGDGGVVALVGGGTTDGNGGAVTIDGADAVGTNRVGGGVSIGSGDGTGSGNGGVIGGIAGNGGPTGNGGGVTWIAGNGGATSGQGGRVTITSGDGQENGGDVDITSGDSTNASNPGGDISLTAGGGTGTPGSIDFITEADGGSVGAVTIRTTTGFLSQGKRQYTYGASDAVTNGTTNQTVLTLGTLSTNGSNLKIIVRVTGHDTGDDGNFIAYKGEQYFYRNGGTVSSVTAFENQNQTAGTANFTSNVSFNIAVSGNDILLRVTNNGGSGTEDFTLDLSVMLTTQFGGASS